MALTRCGLDRSRSKPAKHPLDNKTDVVQKTLPEPIRTKTEKKVQLYWKNCLTDSNNLVKMLQVMGVGMGWGEAIVWRKGIGMERGGWLEVKKGWNSPTSPPKKTKNKKTHSLTFSLKHSHIMPLKTQHTRELISARKASHKHNSKDLSCLQ